MSQIFTDVRQWVGRLDVSGDMNQVSVSSACAEAETSCFTHGATRTSLGLETVTIQAQGYHRVAANSGSTVLRQNQKVERQPYTIVPNGAAAGNRALFVPSTVQATYAVGGSVGDKFPFTVNAKGQGEPLIQLGVLFIAPGSKTANGTSAAFQLPAVAAGQKLYAVLHVFSADGTDPTLDVTVESDTANTFGSPVTALTFNQFAAAGAEAKANSAVTGDEWYQVSYELGGTDPDVSFAVVLGVQ